MHLKLEKARNWSQRYKISRLLMLFQDIFLLFGQESKENLLLLKAVLIFIALNIHLILNPLKLCIHHSKNPKIPPSKKHSIHDECTLNIVQSKWIFLCAKQHEKNKQNTINTQKFLHNYRNFCFSSHFPSLTLQYTPFILIIPFYTHHHSPNYSVFSGSLFHFMPIH